MTLIAKDHGPFKFKNQTTPTGWVMQILFNDKIVGFIKPNTPYQATEYSVRRLTDTQPCFNAPSMDECIRFVVEEYKKKQNALTKQS